MLERYYIIYIIYCISLCTLSYHITKKSLSSFCVRKVWEWYQLVRHHRILVEYDKHDGQLCAMLLWESHISGTQIANNKFLIPSS
jgi:hypothetical protein